MHRFTASDWRRCVRLCARVTGTREDAEDCVQDALTAALAAGNAIDDLPRWVSTVARRRAVDVLRSRTTSARALSCAVHAASTPDHADAVTERAAASWLACRLHELPPMTVAVVRRLAAGSSVAESAEDLGISYRAAESHVTRARRWARRELE